jgi:enoyl-CoA hydratase/carnithine racemase
MLTTLTKDTAGDDPIYMCVAKPVGGGGSLAQPAHSRPLTQFHPSLTLHGSPREDGGFENKLNPELCGEIMARLDEIEKDAAGGHGALVTVSKAGRHYCNGLDLEALMQMLPLGGPESLGFLAAVQRMFARILTFPLPTIAAVNGHAFAGGMLLALAHDHRVMTTDKRQMCMTEIDLGATLTPGFNALLKEKLPRQLAARCMLEAVRLDARELVEHRVVTEAWPQSAVLDKAVALARKLAPKGSPIMREIKEDLYMDAVVALHSSVARSQVAPAAKL